MILWAKHGGVLYQMRDFATIVTTFCIGMVFQSKTVGKTVGMFFARFSRASSEIFQKNENFSDIFDFTEQVSKKGSCLNTFWFD
jgi:hypothetical protein